MTERMMDGTGAGLVDFLTWAADRGKMNASTAGAHKAAVTQVLELEADDFGTIDIKNLDVNDILDRFVRKKGHKYNPDSLATYQGRFRRAVETYLEYLANPSGWKPPRGRGRRRSAQADNAGSTLAPTKWREDAGGPSRTTAVPPAADQHQLITYPFPLRSGVTAYFQLPRELPKSEVDRMVGFLQSLAIDPQPALMSAQQ